MRPPEVYGAIAAVTAKLARVGLPKLSHNLAGNYLYRSLDDVVNGLAPILAEQRLCILPRVLERSAVDRTDRRKVTLVHVALRVAFDLVSADDGSMHTLEAFGEALDEDDKATAKAMSAAYKSIVFQAFCIPVAAQDEKDRSKPSSRGPHHPAPVQGWDAWAGDIKDILKGCQTSDALARVRLTNGAHFGALSRERSDLYSELGQAFERREAEIKSTQCPLRSEAKATIPRIKKTSSRHVEDA